MKLTKIRTFASIMTISAVAGVVALAIPANGAGTTDNRYITLTKDIRSANISVYPEYNWTQEAGTKITGYRASQSFDVLVRTASKAGTIIEAVVTAGGDNVQLGGVVPTTLNPATATEDARAAAVANAKSKASSYAKLLGTSIGKVLSLEEQSSPVYSSPFPMAKADSAVQIDLGEQDVTVTITVRWALN
jgi:uncharacterized protein YggE